MEIEKKWGQQPLEWRRQQPLKWRQPQKQSPSHASPLKHEWPIVKTIKEPACQRAEDSRQDMDKRCQAALLDKTEKKILIVRENVPIELRRWGLPKGKFKTDETTTECSHREVCEEVGITIDDYPHLYRKEGANQVIVFYEHTADEILVHSGPEIITAKWVDLDWLKKNIKMAPWGTYNYALRNFVPTI